MTKEQKLKSQWLDRAYMAEKQVRLVRDLREKDEVRSRELALSASGEKRDSGYPPDMGMIVYAYSGEKYYNALFEYLKVRAEIETEIYRVRDVTLQELLVRRYLMYQTMEKIGEEMGYSIRAVNYRHLEALDNIPDKIAEDFIVLQGKK